MAPLNFLSSASDNWYKFRDGKQYKQMQTSHLEKNAKPTIVEKEQEPQRHLCLRALSNLEITSNIFRFESSAAIVIILAVIFPLYVDIKYLRLLSYSNT